MSEKKDYKPTVVMDFDGVIHSYKSGWKRAEVIPDPVVPGIANAINDLRARGYMVVVVSTRCSATEGMEAVKRYLAENEIIVDGVLAEKPPALCYVDDRAICFKGNAGKLVSQVESFKTWLEDPGIQQADCTEVHLDMGKLTEEQKVELARAAANQRCVVVEQNPHPVEALRPCKGTLWYQREAREVIGRFHGWGSDYEEFCDAGPGNFAAGLIECNDGTVVMCRADTIVFLDREPENGERR